MRGFIQLSATSSAAVNNRSRRSLPVTRCLRQTSTDWKDIYRARNAATRHTRDEVARRIQSLQAEHDALPEQIRLARDSYRGAQAIVAELELQEQLPAFIGVIARAAVARHRAGFTREQGRYEIEIPVEAVEAASTALDADLSTH